MMITDHIVRQSDLTVFVNHPKDKKPRPVGRINLRHFLNPIYLPPNSNLSLTPLSHLLTTSFLRQYVMHEICGKMRDFVA